MLKKKAALWIGKSLWKHVRDSKREKTNYDFIFLGGWGWRSLCSVWKQASRDWLEQASWCELIQLSDVLFGKPFVFAAAFILFAALMEGCRKTRNGWERLILAALQCAELFRHRRHGRHLLVDWFHISHMCYVTYRLRVMSEARRLGTKVIVFCFRVKLTFHLLYTSQLYVLPVALTVLASGWLTSLAPTYDWPVSLHMTTVHTSTHCHTVSTICICG